MGCRVCVVVGIFVLILIKMGQFDKAKYEKAKEVAVRFFEKNKKLKTTCLGEIRFNSDGFMHLIWKNEDKKHKRDWKNQIKRFHLLAYVKPVLQGMKYYQEYSESLENVKIKKRGKPIVVSKIVRYWAFVAIIDNPRGILP